MTEVISVKFKNHGKSYYFDPRGAKIESGGMVVVETAKGLELAECSRGNHEVDDKAVVQPLRPVIRAATEADMRVAEINRKREKEAFGICEQKIAEHGLDMKLVDVECNFEGNKTTFFFTADGRVDFRELVKDLAGIFRNRIELRQIGVRDEAKMLGGLGICGRPYCCSQFMEEFEPVSTKMAKVQNLSLNPTKISGSCGRLMCCLRYEQEAYEDLVKKMPKLGAFVQTPAGYGTVAQINLLREQVKVKLDGDGDDVFRMYEREAVAVVPGGRPKDGEAPPSVLNYVPKPKEPEEEEPASSWDAPEMFAQSMSADKPAPEPSSASSWDTDEPQATVRPEKKNVGGNRRHRGGRPQHSPAPDSRGPKSEGPKSLPPRPERPGDSKPRQPGSNYHRRSRKPRPKPGGEAPKE
jgi:cell fate regulator YaaT (PSP1 superfamily)